MNLKMLSAAMLTAGITFMGLTGPATAASLSAEAMQATFSTGTATPGSRISTPQATPTTSAFARAATAETTGGAVVSTYRWVYVASFPSRAACDVVANDFRNRGISGQCRGPYSGGRFDLYLYLDR